MYDAHKRFVLGCGVLHADETPVAVLDPGAGKTKKAYVWAYARGAFDPTPGVIYEFCAGRGSQYPITFLGPPPDAPEGERGWQGTLVRDEFVAYEAVVDTQKHPARIAAGSIPPTTTSDCPRRISPETPGTVLLHHSGVGSVRRSRKIWRRLASKPRPRSR